MTPFHSTSKTNEKKSIPLAAVAIMPSLFTFLFYLPVLSNGFVNWDDPDNILENPHIRSLSADSLGWMFTHYCQAFWIPLNWLSLAIDYSMGLYNPITYHFHNLFIHCCNTLIVFFLSHKILNLIPREPKENLEKAPWTLSAAFLTSILFGLHPLHVESVAWTTERKDLLCGFYFLLSLWFYLGYATRSNSRAWGYSVCLSFFVLSLLCKPMSVTLPFVLLILDAWPLNRFKSELGRSLLDKIPFFLFSTGIGWVTLQAQTQYGAVPTLKELPLDYRVMNALHSLVFYLYKMALPMNLSVLYPIVLKKTYSLEYVAFAWLVLMIFLACFINRKDRPFVSVAWFYYLALLAPVLGFQYVGNQAAADRFTYLSSLGPFLLVASWAASSLSNRRALLSILCAILTLLLGIGTMTQLSIWKNSVVLWERVVQVATPYIYDSIYEHLGDAYFTDRRWEESMGAYNTALAMNPSNYGLHEKKGIIFLNKNLPAQAAAEFGQELAVDPKNALTHRYLYMADQKLGLFDAALAEVQKAIQLDPNLPGVYNSLGAVYFSMKKYALASAAFGIAHQKDPQNLDCLMNGAAADSFASNWDGALQSLQAAVSLRPDNADLYQKLGQIYEKKGDQTSAQAAYITGQKLAVHTP